MAAQSGKPPLPKARGQSSYSQQTKLHTKDSDITSSRTSTSDALPTLKTTHSASLPPLPAASILHQEQPAFSPLIVHRRSPASTVGSYAHSTTNNVQLLNFQSRPESDYIRETPRSPASASRLPPVSPRLIVTDFPVYEEPEKPDSNDSNDVNIVEKAFSYLQDDDDDDDVIHPVYFNQSDNHRDSFDDEDEEDMYSVNTNELNIPTDRYISKNDSGIQTLSSTGSNERRMASTHSYENLNEPQPLMAHFSQTTVSEDYDSDFDDSSNEDEEPPTRRDSSCENNEAKRNQMLLELRLNQILSGIVQEWLRKEESYCEQLKKMHDQLLAINIADNPRTLIQRLIEEHTKVYQNIQHLSKNAQQSDNLTEQLTDTVNILTDMLPTYLRYIELNLAPIRKALEKRPIANGLSSEDLLSIPPKQFLQILSQIQDLYQTAQSFESTDQKSVFRLYTYAQRCRTYGSRQDENINKVILKNEDVAILAARGGRDRCRLILYPDVLVCCHLRAKLLASPKYVLLWFIPVSDLQWSISQSYPDDDPRSGDSLRSNVKSAYKELEKTSKTNNSIAARLTKNVKKHEMDFNLAQSKLQLILFSPSRESSPSVILFSSAYQRQDWIELIEKTKQELLLRTSANINQTNQPTRIVDTQIQKRLDLIKPNSSETNSNDSATNIPTTPSTKTYSGTFSITIHSIHGAALLNPMRQYHTLPMTSSALQQLEKNYKFYVAVEIDSYNTFYPYAQTAQQPMLQHETIEFKGEVFQVELEYSLAFRLLIYRVEIPTSNSKDAPIRSPCIGRFHRDIDPALKDCQRSPSGTISIESQSGDLKLKVSLKYSARAGTFKRQGSKRSLAVFGKSIERLITLPDGLIDGIPRVIVKCIKLVEQDGLTETGIYRVCCVASDLQKLRQEFDRNSRRAEDILDQKNVHVPANLLKLFFRELPEPIFTSALYKQFVNAIQLTDKDYQRVMLLKTFELLDSANQKILFYLFDHLIRVSEYSHMNMMHLDNLAVVFGPTLMRPSKLIVTPAYSSGEHHSSAGNGPATATDLDQMSSELQGSMYQCQVVLACLKLRQARKL